MLVLLVGVLVVVLLGLLVDTVLLALEISAQDDGGFVLLGEVFALLQQAEAGDVVTAARGLRFDRRDRRGRVGVPPAAGTGELRPGERPSTGAGPRQGLEVRIDVHHRWLRCFRHGVNRETNGG